ncbi:MAG: hypothetical protein AAGK47_05220, partial [Bacteroidota bacterium]
INAALGKQQKQQTKTVWMWRSLRVAAAVLVLLVTGGIVGSYVTQQYNNNAVAALQEIAPEYLEMERYFQKEVSQKMKRLASYQKEKVVLSDLEQLDIIMEELKSELLRTPKGNEEQILNNLISSYQTKIAILERVLERVESAQLPANNKTSNNELSI